MQNQSLLTTLSGTSVVTLPTAEYIPIFMHFHTSLMPYMCVRCSIRFYLQVDLSLLTQLHILSNHPLWQSIIVDTARNAPSLVVFKSPATSLPCLGV
jgi:hypothetical protein